MCLIVLSCSEILTRLAHAIPTLRTSKMTWRWDFNRSTHDTEQLFTELERGTIVLAYTSRNCFHLFLLNFLKYFCRTSACRPLVILKTIHLNKSWVHLSLKSKRNTYLWILLLLNLLFCWYCLSRWLRLFKTIFFFRNWNKTGSHLVLLRGEYCRVSQG